MDDNLGVNTEQVADVQNDNDIDNTSVEDSQNTDDITSEITSDDKIKQTKDENAKYAAARRQAEKEVTELKNKQNNFAKLLGFQTFEELDVAQKQKTYTDQGYDPQFAQKLYEVDIMLEKMKLQENKTRIIEEKSKLQGKKYFKELEPEIDSILNSNPALPVNVIFSYLKGEKIDDLVTQENKAATQRQLNNISNKSHIKPDTGGIDTDIISLDEDEWKFYSRLNPKGTKEDYLKFKKMQKRS